MPDLSPGPDLDRLLCERIGSLPRLTWVVGKKADSITYSSDWESAARDWLREHQEYCAVHGLEVYLLESFPALSSTLTGADQVLVWMRAQGYTLRLEQQPDGTTSALFYRAGQSPGDRLYMWEPDSQGDLRTWSSLPGAVALAAAAVLDLGGGQPSPR